MRFFSIMKQIWLHLKFIFKWSIKYTLTELHKATNQSKKELILQHSRIIYFYKRCYTISKVYYSKYGLFYFLYFLNFWEYCNFSSTECCFATLLIKVITHNCQVNFLTLTFMQLNNAFCPLIRHVFTILSNK